MGWQFCGNIIKDDGVEKINIDIELITQTISR